MDRDGLPADRMTRQDPNPFPRGGVIPLWCSSLHPGTADRRWGFFDRVGATFDEDAADRVLKWFRNLRHTQGPLAGKRFDLSPEQVWLVREAFGWMRPDGLRLFRIVFVEMGRGNGKSQLGAGIAGYLLLADGEIDPEIVGAAATRPMARKYCFNRLKAMIEANAQIKAKVDLFRHEIRRKQGNGFYEATSADVTSAWGGAPHGILFDEVHAQPGRELWDALETAMGKRAQPMMWGFTTAGHDRTSLCWELHERTRELAEGTIEDVEFLGAVWAAGEDDDWTDSVVWRKANPMMGLAFEESFLEAKCAKALSTPAFQNTFRTMYLSQWVGQETRFIDMARWDDCGGELMPPGKRPAFGGVDLSSTTDLSGFTVAAPNGDEVELHVKLYAPAEGIVERERRDRLPYRVWERQGLLTLTPGTTIDQDYIKADILSAKEEWDLGDVGYDRWNASKVVKELRDEGVEMVEMGQGFASMSAPTKELLRLVVAGKVRHGKNPALRAQVSNTAALTDAAGNVKPDKAKSGSRIDGVVSSIMAVDGLMRRGRGPSKRSVYEDRGLMLA